jgi:hypothetical protein
VRALSKRRLQTPVTITPAGAPGRLKASAALWPRARRRRGWWHTRPHRRQTGPPQAWPAGQPWSRRCGTPPLAEGQRRFQALRTPSQATLPAACRGLADEAEARLPPRKVPPRHRPYERPSHRAERACEEAATHHRHAAAVG